MSSRFAARIVTWLTALLPTIGLLANEPDESAPTAIEQALIENACVGALPPGALDSESYRQCLKARLLSLRADFGRDLEQVTAAERRELDATCTGLRTAGREAYLDCLDAKLASLGARRKPAPALEPSPLQQVAAQSPTNGVQTIEPSQAAGWFVTVVIATLGLAGVAAGGARFVRKPPRPPCGCRECGAVLAAAGDLCAPCRREAAKSRRRAQTEQQAERAALPKEQSALPVEQAALPVEQSALPVEQPPLPEEQATLREEETGAESEAEREIQIEPPPEAEVAGRPVETVPARVREALIDPYVVLGIMPGATPEEIRAAYEDAKSKFDPSRVSHLSAEVQKYFKARALALDRAYQLLA